MRAQLVKNLPAMQETQETWVLFLGQEDPLEEDMATHSSILGWKIPWTKKPDGLHARGLQRVGHNWETNTFTFQGIKRRFYVDLEVWDGENPEIGDR